MMVHRDHAKQMVVVLGDGLAGPVLVEVTDLEVLEGSAEGPVVHRHDHIVPRGAGLTGTRVRCGLISR